MFTRSKRPVYKNFPKTPEGLSQAVTFRDETLKKRPIRRASKLPEGVYKSKHAKTGHTFWFFDYTQGGKVKRASFHESRYGQNTLDMAVTAKKAADAGLPVPRFKDVL